VTELALAGGWHCEMLGSAASNQRQPAGNGRRRGGLVCYSITSIPMFSQQLRTLSISGYVCKKAITGWVPFMESGGTG
jgi:hypothetical protein